MIYNRLMVIALVEGLIWWLNVFPSSNGLSDMMSRATIVLGNHNTYINQKRITFGAYVMVGHRP